MTDPTGDAPIFVASGAPTDEETAAIAAVFAQLALERAATVEQLPGPARRSAWDRSRRPLRTPLDRG